MMLILVFASGFAGLVYEVLWMKQLGLLFGNTSHAAAATLAAFFAGLAAGSWFWGRRCRGMTKPLRVFGRLQVGIAATALLYFGVIRIYEIVYPLLYQGIASDGLLLMVKFGLALLLVFPPAFFMGGTVPVMGEFLVGTRHKAFGATAALIYGVNTLGAAFGACLAGFYLPLWLGFHLTCVGAMAVSLAVAGGTFWICRGGGRGPGVARMAAEEGSGAASGTSRGTVMLLCFLSGFGVLALEVVWTRMFAQVLENSVYPFAAILALVLLCLAAGALVSSWLSRLSIAPRTVLCALVLAGGVAISATPFVFMRLTNGLQIQVSTGSWFDYMLLILRRSALTIGPPALVLGTVFPYLMKIEERQVTSAGGSLGRLSAVNTAGAILGSLLCGFVMLDTLGMWRTMQAIAFLYIATALAVPLRWGNAGIIMKTLGVVLLLALLWPLNPAALPVMSVDKLRAEERTIEIWEASGGTVAVVEGQTGLSIKVNSHYGLGSTGAFMQEKIQADLPLMIWPETESIFFLGLGTGITAGSALDSQFPNVKRIVACELVPEVVEAARKYVTNYGGYDYTGGLFSDPRATVLVEDGRHYLMATDATFDMINADLFVPFRSGAGSLYTREHFQRVKERLTPGGVFVQWLPLYQLTEYEFSVIAKTMTEVFDQVSLWRNNFQPGDEVVAFVGHEGGAPLPSVDLDNRENRIAAVAGKSHRDLQHLALPFDPQAILFFYCGNVTAARDLFDEYPVNTDDRPLIEYMAPRNYRRRQDGKLPWFVGPRLARMVEDLQEICPPDRDPLLVNRSGANRRLPAAGVAFHRARIWDVIGNESECAAAWNRFVEAWLDDS